LKDTLIISYDFFKKVLNLAEYLELSSHGLVCLISEVEKNDMRERPFLKNLCKKLFSLNNSATKVKEEIIEAAIKQEEILNNDELLKNSLIKMTQDFKKMHDLCEKFSEPTYYINKEGRLTK